MVRDVKMPSLPGRRSSVRACICALVPATLAVLAGCGGSTLNAGPAAHVIATVDPSSANASKSCSTAVLETLAHVLERVYREGVASERTGSAEYLIAHSAALVAAVERGDKPAARTAAKALLATGHMTNLSITRAAKPFISLGGAALAPIHGTLNGASGTPIASYVASVWADNGFLIEGAGITQGLLALRQNGRYIASSAPLTAEALADEGTLTQGHVTYQYTSLPAQAYPSGKLRIYLLMPSSSIAPVCGRTRQDTAVDTLRRVAQLIYTGESGASAHKQVRRVQRNQALLEAVADGEPEATRLAIGALLNHHIVRMRVSVAGQLLSDVGGPYVLAPVTAPLRRAGQEIGSLVLSIQDDEGYLRLTRRLAGLDVLMYMSGGGSGEGSPAQPKLVKDSLGPGPGPALADVPASGGFSYEGRAYSVFTVHAKAFPTGPLTIRVLVPNPYL
jgi:hypothetical protein